MSAPVRGSFDQGSDMRYKLVKQASENYRRVANRLERTRKLLARTELDFEDAKRGLKLAIDAVQAPLPVAAPPPDARTETCVACGAQPEEAHVAGCVLDQL